MAIKTETNTPAMGKRVEKAFRDQKGFGRRKKLFAFYEHGQWYVKVIGGDDDGDRDLIYSVVDAEGGDSVDGFDFEQAN